MNIDNCDRPPYTNGEGTFPYVERFRMHSKNEDYTGNKSEGYGNIFFQGENLSKRHSNNIIYEYRSKR